MQAMHIWGNQLLLSVHVINYLIMMFLRDCIHFWDIPDTVIALKCTEQYKNMFYFYGLIVNGCLRFLSVALDIFYAPSCIHPVVAVPNMKFDVVISSTMSSRDRRLAQVIKGIKLYKHYILILYTLGMLTRIGWL